MIDLYMLLMLAGLFGLFYGFIVWCGRVIDEGGDRS